MQVNEFLNVRKQNTQVPFSHGAWAFGLRRQPLHT